MKATLLLQYQQLSVNTLSAGSYIYRITNLQDCLCFVIGKRLVAEVNRYRTDHYETDCDIVDTERCFGGMASLKINEKRTTV